MFKKLIFTFSCLLAAGSLGLAIAGCATSSDGADPDSEEAAELLDDEAVESVDPAAYTKPIEHVCAYECGGTCTCPGGKQGALCKNDDIHDTKCPPICDCS